MSTAKGHKKYKRQLQKAFRRACKNFPGLGRDVKPLGMGSFGLVVEHGDGRHLTKILHRPRKNRDPHAFAERSFQNEINVLRILTDHPLTSIQTPVLIEEPEITDDNKRYLGRFKMTRIEGNSQSFYMPEESMPAEETKKLHENAGRALAVLHREVATTPLQHYKRTFEDYGDKIEQIENLPDEINQALEKADNYLQAHKRSGFVHADFHAGNIIFNENRDVVGFVDFAFAGHNSNILIDFMNLNEKYREDFITAYEQESDMKIDRHMITATVLAMNTNYLVNLEKFDDEVDKDEPDYEKRKQRCEKEKVRMHGEIEKHLEQMSEITGYHPS